MFERSVSAHRPLPSEELEMLREHLSAQTPEAKSPWRLASTPELRALQAWAEEFSLFGREVAFRVADAGVEVLERMWDRAAAADPGNEVLAAIAAGNIDDPAAQIAAARLWLAHPSEDAARAADRTLESDSPQVELDEEEFDYMREHPFVWRLLAAQDLVAITNHPNPELFVGRVAVGAAAAVDTVEGGGVTAVREVIRQRLSAWAGLPAGVDSP